MGLEFKHGPLAKQRGGAFRPATYLIVLLAVASFGAGFAFDRWLHRPIVAANIELPLWETELYQLTPEEWNDEAYTVTIVPEEETVCDSFVQGSTCYIRI